MWDLGEAQISFSHSNLSNTMGEIKELSKVGRLVGLRYKTISKKFGTFPLLQPVRPIARLPAGSSFLAKTRHFYLQVGSFDYLFSLCNNINSYKFPSLLNPEKLLDPLSFLISNLMSLPKGGQSHTIPSITSNKPTDTQANQTNHTNPHKNNPWQT